MRPFAVLLGLATALPAATLTIVHFNVGYGDSTLILSDKPAVSMLIDGGGAEDAATVIDGLRGQKVAQLDYVIATHRDASHIGGLRKVIKAIPVSGLGGVYDRDKAWQNAPTVPSLLTPGWKFAKEGLEILCVAANGNTISWQSERSLLDENARSLAFRVKLGNFVYFVGGDLTGGGPMAWGKSADIEIHAAADVGPVAVLRVNHHGSATSSSPAFLAALNPIVAIISIDQGQINDQLLQWPARVVMDRLLARPALAAVYLTGDASTSGGLTKEDLKKVKTKQGNITITTDGASAFQVNGTSYDLPK